MNSDERQSFSEGRRCLEVLVPVARKAVIPLSLCGVGVWLLVGCIYLPIPEHRVDKSRPDFRKLVGDEHSKARIRPGSITRAQVIAILGKPQYRSADRTAIGYELETRKGLLVYPLCFSGWPTDRRVYGVRLIFRPDGILADVETAMAESGTLAGTEPYDPNGRAIDLLNRHTPVLLPVGKLPPATRP